MVEITNWMNNFIAALNNTFAQRVWFVGLQGSYARGEATENSDIDVVVILDQVSFEDLEKYNSMLDALPNRELVCGFVSGVNELLNWEPSDLFQFYHDTKAIKGSLDDLLPLFSEQTVNRAIKIGACNIYHGCVHNMLHDKSKEILIDLYKSASFVVQAIYFKKTGIYLHKQKELLDAVSANEKYIVKTYLNLKNGAYVEFDEMSALLFETAKNWIDNTK